MAQAHSIDLFLRKHTAALVKSWSARDKKGRYLISHSRILGAVINANVLPAPAGNPAPELQYEHTERVPIALKLRHEPGSFDWRNHFSYIPPANMARIDAWIHSVFVNAIYFHWDGAGRKNRNESIRALMDRYGLTEEDIDIETLSMAVRRMMWDEQNTGIPRPAGLGLVRKKHRKPPRFCDKSEQSTEA